VIAELPSTVGPNCCPSRRQTPRSGRHWYNKVWPPAERTLYDLLTEDESSHIDDLVEISGLTSSEVPDALFDLELKGVVRQLSGKQFLKVLL
jgi:predicted Rossmann fold nucleotide-binding protein DprA/Smf involved in DNA uptake